MVKSTKNKIKKSQLNKNFKKMMNIKYKLIKLNKLEKKTNSKINL